MEQTTAATGTKSPQLPDELQTPLSQLCDALTKLPDADRIEALNHVKLALHEISPFVNEPVDCVVWRKLESVTANDYNPNAVAPPEMELLQLSIDADGYTQPVVAGYDEELDSFVVVDGFHRNRIARESETIRARVKGYLPLVEIRTAQEGRSERIASTIRHNRARGKHQIDKMSKIVLELKRRNWSDKKIGKQLGMDPDEVLRLSQITGLTEAFKDLDFSIAWEADLTTDDDSIESLIDNDDAG